MCSDYETAKLPTPTDGTEMEPYTQLQPPAVSGVRINSAAGDNGAYEEISMPDFVAPSPPARVNMYETIH